MNYCNLHSHSTNSIRDSVSKLGDMVAKAAELKMPALALTDHGTMGGSLALNAACQEHGIKPLFGCELYIAPASRFDKDKNHRYDHLTVLAMNNTGWTNLSILVSESYKADHFYHKPRIDRELLRKHSEGLIVLSGCLAGGLARAILSEQNITFEDEDHQVMECVHDACGGIPRTALGIRDTISWYKSVFKDRYYLEIQNHGIAEENIVRDYILNIANDFSIKIVATGDTHFVNKEDIETHNIMIAIRDRTTINDPKLHKYPGDGYYLPTQEYLNERFADCKFAVTNTLEIAERCNVSLNLGNFIIPRPKGVTVYNEDDMLRKEAYEGLTRRLGGLIPAHYIARLEEELLTICRMTFPSYFLMVQDYISWAKSQNIPVGPGRGSAGGSLVSYSLGIIDIDPVKYGLSFARFLNRGRSSVPVIDFPEYSFEHFRTDTQL